MVVRPVRVVKEYFSIQTSHGDLILFFCSLLAFFYRGVTPIAHLPRIRIVTNDWYLDILGSIFKFVGCSKLFVNIILHYNILRIHFDWGTVSASYVSIVQVVEIWYKKRFGYNKIEPLWSLGPTFTITIYKTTKVTNLSPVLKN